MKLTSKQWDFVQEFIPAPQSKTERGRPRQDDRKILEGILWILKTGCRWKDLPKDYPPYQTCHRRFQSWIKQGVMRAITQALVRHLQKEGGIDLTETYIDATFVGAKKGALKLEKPSREKAPKSWPLQTAGLFLSPYMLRVLHHMRVSLLEQRFGTVIHETSLCELWVTKLTIATNWMGSLKSDIESNLLLPISAIERLDQLRMDDLLEDTEDDGELSDFLLG